LNLFRTFLNKVRDLDGCLVTSYRMLISLRRLAVSALSDKPRIPNISHPYSCIIVMVVRWCLKFTKLIKTMLAQPAPDTNDHSYPPSVYVHVLSVYVTKGVHKAR